MKLVIAEKPSVANSIGKVIGANKRKDGYLDGNGYIVSYCIGHVIKMSNPDKYDENYLKWNIEDLPIIPQDYIYEVSNDTKKQFLILKKLFNDKRVEEIINACDAGREGELIFRLLYNYLKCKKKVKRLWISSLENSEILNGFNNLRDGKEFDNLYFSACARAKGDWLVGMNLSRLYSCLYNQNYSVGRVQTPTLAMIVDRQEKINSFKKEKYYTVEILGNGISFFSGRINDKSLAEKLKDSIKEKVKLYDVIENLKITKPDKIYDLTTLQRECNKYFGFTAKHTLDYAQSLYEKKLITYPRTDSRFLTNDMKDNVKEYFEKIGYEVYEENFEKCFNSTKVSDHHGIIPTLSSIDYNFNLLKENEIKVFKLIQSKFMASSSENLIESITKCIIKIYDFDFVYEGKVIKEEGFMKHLKEFKKFKESKNVYLNKGDEILIDEVKINERHTTPPKHYTDDTLLKSMENASKVEVESERKGLGTPATRTGIIEGLILKGLVERKDKNLIPTKKGISLITIVCDFLKSEDTTSQWESKLYDISKGKLKEEEFLDLISNEIKSIVSMYSHVKNS